MANEGPLQKLGWLVSGGDYRNSTLSGTTHGGNNGSPQFQAVRASTVADLTVLLCTVSGQSILGILQNKPGVGDAADVGFSGVSKAVAGSTFGPGIELMVDSSGCLIPYASAAGRISVGVSLQTVSAVSEVFSAAIYGFGGHGGSVA